MKRKPWKIVPLIAVLACLAGTLIFTPVKSLFTRHGNMQMEEEEEEEESGMGKQLEAWWQTRAFPEPANLNHKWWAAWQHFQAMRTPDLTTRTEGASQSARLHYGAWSPIGPSTGVGGRILSLAIHPVNTTTIFAGSASGGIWKSTNSGTNWSYLPVNLPVLGVPSIIISTANPDVMYAGTGEVYRADTSNLGYNVWKARGSYGIGIIKSTDGGVTWTQSLAQNAAGLFGVQRLRFHPTDDNTIYACTTDGLYRSTDAGTTWNNIAAGKIYVTDVVINTTNPNQVMITVGNLTNSDKGIYRTTNASNATPTWTKLSAGLPTGFNGLARFGYLSGNTVYAGFGKGSGNELYETTNFGTTWSVLNGSGYCSYQYWCTNAVTLNPGNSNNIILGGVELYSYNISAENISNITGSVHADMHAIEFDPSNSNIFYVACDGGVYRTANGGGSFSQRNNGLSATQFYASFGVSTTTANLFVGGLQDNGVWRYNAGAWSQELMGDGGPCIFVPGTNTVFASKDAREVYRSTNGGLTFNLVTTTNVWRSVADSRTAFMAPVAVSASNTNIIYIGSDNLHKSTTGGTNGSFSFDDYSSANNFIQALHKTAITIAVSPVNPNKVYVSASPFAQFDNDADGLHVNPPPDILRTTTGNTPFTSIKSNLPNRFVNDFAISSTDDDSVMVVLGGYGSSHVYLTGNGGASWIDRGTGLPDVPFNAIVFDPGRAGTVYVGCDLGVYVTNNYGQTWYDFNGGFQDATMVFDLQITADNRIVAATHGKGAWISNLANSATLPANILEFTGVQKNTYNELKWQASENNVSHYELERRIDNGGFQKITTISAKNTSGIVSYSYNDEIAAVPGINFYYRLKITDADGVTNYSNVVLIKIARAGSLVVLGNPVTAASSIQMTLPNAAQVTLKLFDSKGSLVALKQVNGLAGANRYSFSVLGALSSGHYILEATIPAERFSKRVVVQR